MVLGNNQKGLILMLFCTLFTSVGQLFWKAGSLKIDFANVLSFLNMPLMLGSGVYVLGMCLMLLAFRKGDLSLLYPVLAMGFVWVSLMSPYFFPIDSMNFLKWLGIAVIVISVSLLGWGSRNAKMERFNLKGVETENVKMEEAKIG